MSRGYKLKCARVPIYSFKEYNKRTISTISKPSMGLFDLLCTLGLHVQAVFKVTLKHNPKTHRKCSHVEKLLWGKAGDKQQTYFFWVHHTLGQLTVSTE